MKAKTHRRILELAALVLLLAAALALGVIVGRLI
jgi:hypothetical protein